MTYQVTVTPTVEAYNHDDCIANKCARYIRETFDGTSFSVDIEFPTPRPDPPSEDPFYEPEEHPCGGTRPDLHCCDDDCDNEEYYCSLLPWWKDYVEDCTDWSTSDQDSMLLITDNTGLGGIGYLGGKYAVSAAYQVSYFDCFDSADSGGCPVEDDAAQTCVHEVGHNLGLQHNDGWADESSDQYTTTPMINAYTENLDGTDNDCGHYIEDIDTTKEKCHSHTWSDCSQSQL